MSSTPRLSKPATPQTPSWHALLLLLSAIGCTHDWTVEPTSMDPRDGSPDGASVADTDATLVDPGLDAGNSAPTPDADSAEASERCGATTCGHGSCNASGGCDCEPGYRYDGTRCQPGSCTSASGEPVCGSNEVCMEREGNAACECIADHRLCQGQCVATGSDAMNCGSCGFQCAAGVACTGGVCEQKVSGLILTQHTSCALLTSADGKFPIRCWGQGTNDLYRDQSAKSSTPRAITGVSAGRGLALSERHRCVIDPNADKLQCWGRCGPECGLTEPATNNADLRELSTPGIAEVSAASGFNGGNTCVLNGVGSAQCFGYAAMVTDTIDRRLGTFLTVANAAQPPRFFNISGPGAHSCGAARDGRVVCWGYNNLGQLGVPGATSGAAIASYVLLEPPLTGELMQVTTVEANSAVSCAIVTPGDVFCWGGSASALGLLGNGSKTTYQRAVKVMGLPSNIVELAVGFSVVLARTQANTVYGWGVGAGLGLGPDVTGDISDGQAFSSAVEIPALRGALEIAAGSEHSCARMENGAVLCWGNNTHGQLGDGSEIARAIPTRVQGL